MKYTQLLSKPSKAAPHEADSINAKFLVQGAFVRQEMAGVYSWLPLGLRVLNKVQEIIREELNALGAQEILMPALQPKENWETTGRWDSVDVLFKVPSQTDREYALGPTHEEIVTPLVGSFVHSYKDLPTAVYQIQTKYRDELRAKSGVLRGREFGMKDLYSFHANQEDLERFYELVKQAYLRIFKRCGLDAKIVEASGGSFTKKFSHEFQVISPAGEDNIIACSKCTFAQNSEIATYQPGQACPLCGAQLQAVKGIEIGNIFDLGTKFTSVFKVGYTDEQGERQTPLMACFGIGTTRLVGAIVESNHDDKGIIWPEEVAPYQIHLVTIQSKDADVTEQVMSTVSSLYDEMVEAGLQVFWDDRTDASAGEKLATSDLLGLPVRILVSQKSLEQGGVEIKQRNADEAEIIPILDVIERLKED
ncbi:MAG: proline--tRNA ligase [Patescibacteria group bacterium]